MLTKNIYIIYRAGFGGSYINWAFNISDLDTRPNTVKNPINTNKSAKFGGVGTSHHHIRIPTHQSYDAYANWVIYNRPTQPKIYIISLHGQDDVYYQLQLIRCITNICNHDPQSVFVHIHDNNFSDINSYGLINCVTKWPTFFAANAAGLGIQLPFDPFDCRRDQTFRNWIANDLCFSSKYYSPPLDHKLLEEQIQNIINWYKVRNKYQPHEVNQETYINEISIADRVFELSCYDIATADFVKIFENILIRSKVSDNFDLSFVKEFHQNYINAQQNLQWFDSLDAWRSTGKLDSYLTSHSIVEACLIKEMFMYIKKNRSKDPQIWKAFYHDVKDDSWPTCDKEQGFYQLDPSIQAELIENFHYKPPMFDEQKLLNFESNWKNQTIYDINHSYQELVAGS